jgi:hypothetical protein
MFSRVRLLIVVFSIVLVLSCSHKPDTKNAIVIPFELVNDRIVITATVNDSEGRYMLDTGASMTFTDVPLTNLPYVQTSTIQYVGVSERHKVYKLSEITINNQKIASDSLVTNNSKPQNNEILTPNRLNGVLGLMAFSGYWCEISFSSNMMYLRKNEPEGYRTRITADFENYMIVVPSRVDTAECRMVLDTGFPRRVGFPTSIVPKIDSKNKTTVLSMAIAKQEIFCEKLTSLGKSFRGVFGYTDSPLSYVGMSGGLGVLGVPFLQKFDMAFDLTESKTAGKIQVLVRQTRSAVGYGIKRIGRLAFMAGSIKRTDSSCPK